MTDRDPALKEALEAVIDSVMQFSEQILTAAERYTISEIEIANNFKMAIIFYRAREKGEEMKLQSLPTIKELNDIVRIQLASLNETVATEPKEKPDEVE
jgi:hypothetical protein